MKTCDGIGLETAERIHKCANRDMRSCCLQSLTLALGGSVTEYSYDTLYPTGAGALE